MKYAIYNDTNVTALYTGDAIPELTPNVPICDEDYHMAMSNPTNFKVQSNC